MGLRLLQEAFPWDLLVGSVVSNSLVVVLAALGLILILMPLGAKRKLFCLPLLLPLLIPVQHEIENGGLVITVFDVGQGLAVLLKTKSHALLYDTAAGIDEQINIANSVIIPSLQKAGIGRIDKLVISHGDNDHSGGVSAILDKLSVGVGYGSDSVTIPVSSDFQLNSCVRGLDWIWDEVRFQFLNPGSVFNDANNNSCVLRVSAANGSVLLPGDIELEAEIELSARYRELLASEVLIAPHHGSQSSSSYAFIKQVQPRFVVYSSGYKNQFAHPAAAVETKYASYDAIGFSTAATGMLKFDMSNGESTTYVHSHRHENQKYWRHQACAESADMFREPLN